MNKAEFLKIFAPTILDEERASSVFNDFPDFEKKKEIYLHFSQNFSELLTFLPDDEELWNFSSLEGLTTRKDFLHYIRRTSIEELTDRLDDIETDIKTFAGNYKAGQSTKKSMPEMLANTFSVIFSIVVFAVCLVIGASIYSAESGLSGGLFEKLFNCFKQDTFYFTLELIKDIVGGIGVWIIIRQIINTKKNKKTSVGVLIFACFVGVAALVLSIMLYICSNFVSIKGFGDWGKSAYTWVAGSLIFIPVICLVVLMLYIHNYKHVKKEEQPLSDEQELGDKQESQKSQGKGDAQ